MADGAVADGEDSLYVPTGTASADQTFANKERLQHVLCEIASIRAWLEHAQVLGQTLAVTIHLDTGMNRLGLPADERALLAESHALQPSPVPQG